MILLNMGRSVLPRLVAFNPHKDEDGFRRLSEKYWRHQHGKPCHVLSRMKTSKAMYTHDLSDLTSLTVAECVGTATVIQRDRITCQWIPSTT
jgi:hypothetical protein